MTNLTTSMFVAKFLKAVALIFGIWFVAIILLGCAVAFLIRWIGKGESDVNGDPERDAGILK